jgi:hypothetical protein
VNLIDEEDVLTAEVGEYGGQVAGTLDGRARCRLDINAYFGGDDMGEAGLAEAGRPVEQDVVKGFTAASGSGDGYLQIFLGPVLSGEIGKASRSETGIKWCILGAGLTRYNASYFALPPQQTIA